MDHLRRLIGLSGVLSYLAIPASLAAQVGGGVGFFGAMENAEPITRTLGGISLSVGTPFVGIRGSGALGISSLGGQTTFQDASDLVWATNADLMLGPVNAGLGEGFMPYTFVGLGMESSAQPLQFTDAIRTWSYGGGIQLGLGSIFSVNGEARWKRLAASATYADSQFVRNIEYRIGVGFHFGGSRSRSPLYGSRGSTAPTRRISSNPPSAPRQRYPSGTTWPVSNSTSSSAAARSVISTGEQYIGVPYRYGGTSPRTGFDCSGFVQYIYAQQGVDLPRTSRQMAGVGTAVEPSERALAVGDLMLFSQGGRISHGLCRDGSQSELEPGIALNAARLEARRA